MPAQRMQFLRPTPPHQIQNEQFTYRSGGFTPFDLSSSNSYERFYQQQNNIISPPPMYGAGYFYSRNPSDLQLPHQQALMQEYYPYAVGVPQQQLQRGYTHGDPLASLIALQQSVMVTQVQRAILSNVAANTSATNAEYIPKKSVTQKKEKATVNIKVSTFDKYLICMILMKLKNFMISISYI